MSQFIDPHKLKQIVEAALMAADAPLSVDQLQKLFAHGELDSDAGRAQIRDTLKSLEAEAEGRGYELKRVASGYRYQVRQELSEWISRLWEERPPRYTRALLETLALIAYRQPVTRGDIEQVRGVSVSQNIMRTLQERGWIRVVGQREVPGRPSLYGTTRQFLDYFDLKSLDQLPPLDEIRALVEPLAEDRDGDTETESSADGAREAATEESAAEAATETAPDDGEGRRARGGEGEDTVTEERRSGAADGEVADAESDAPAAHSAEVVRLPTSPRR